MAKAEETGQIADGLEDVFRRLEKSKAQRFYETASKRSQELGEFREELVKDSFRTRGMNAQESLKQTFLRRNRSKGSGFPVPAKSYIK
jgi:hypothetical protein